MFACSVCSNSDEREASAARRIASPSPDSQPKLRKPQPRRDRMLTPPAAKPSAERSAYVTGSSSTRLAPASTAARARTHLSKTAGSPRWT